MIEKHFVLEEADPQIFFGAANANLRMLRALCPKLRIVGRDNVIKVMGGEEDMADFEDTSVSSKAIVRSSIALRKKTCWTS